MVNHLVPGRRKRFLSIVTGERAEETITYIKRISDPDYVDKVKKMANIG